MDEFSIKQRGCCGGGGGGNKCGRWNPTTEQVKVLMDLFRSGLRTPSTDQIQKISTQLSFYGKIESKNVFYWFQNHKARERQKRRRVYVTEPPNDQIHCKHNYNNIPSSKQFLEINDASDAENVIETLQLFPLNSVKESESQKLRSYAGEMEHASFIYACRRDDPYHDHPPLDLRLSFM